MTIRGPQAIRAIDEALKDIRREEAEITKRIARATDRVGKLHETELDQLRGLAMVRLSPDAQKELTGKLSAAETRARDMLKQHARDMEALETELARLEETLISLAAERDAALGRIGVRQDEIEALSEAVRTRLAGNDAYGQAQARYEEISKMAVEADKKADQAEADREQKGQPYREDSLFIYLWDRAFGTAQYKAGNITRMFDAMVARHIRFHDARPNFVMLNEIPARLREHAERLEADTLALAAEIETLENAALDAAGGDAARTEIETLNGRIGEIDAAVVASEDEREALTEKQKKLAEGGDPTFEEAVTVLTAAMRSTEIDVLVTEARQTGTPQDDTIVIKIEELRRRIGQEEAELSDQRARLKMLETRRRELEDIGYEFKKARFDDPRSRFGEDRLVGDLLTEFLKGGITAASYWGQWRQSQNWAGGPGPIIETGDTGRGPSGFSIPRGGFSPRPKSGDGWGKSNSSRGGGFSRPRGGFKTGGGFKGGGGFKTGGGF